MSIGELLRSLNLDTCRIQFLHETIMGAREVKRTKNRPAHTRIDFVTAPENFAPKDLAFQCGLPNAEKPSHVCVMVWIPSAEYYALASKE